MKSFLIVLCIGLGHTALACSCIDNNRRSAQNLVFSTLAFEGKIIATKTISSSGVGGMYKALFRVTNWISPRSGADTISIFTLRNCGWEFREGQSWLIFASRRDGRLRSDYCDDSLVINDTRETQEILKYFRDLSSGTHDIDDSLLYWAGEYRLTGKVDNGEPVGRWLKLKGTDTLAYYNFKGGSLVGMVMETNEDVYPRERRYYDFQKVDKETLVVTLYDGKKKPKLRCEYRGGPGRIRLQSLLPSDLEYTIAGNFNEVQCKDLSKKPPQKVKGREQ